MVAGKSSVDEELSMIRKRKWYLIPVNRNASIAGIWRRARQSLRDEQVFLTSLPKNQGIIRLKNSSRYRNLQIDTELTGNKAGTQSIYLRADRNLSSYIAVEASGAYFFINEINGDRKRSWQRYP